MSKYEVKTDGKTDARNKKSALGLMHYIVTLVITRGIFRKGFVVRVDYFASQHI